ncbi:MAG: hypothetical protein ACLRFJ_04140 [Alphaproteobacteria bacterium]
MKTYIPDNSLITTWSDAKKIKPYPFMSVFEFDNKRLIYVGTKHNMPDLLSPESFYAINYAFDNFNIDCVVTEFEHTYKNIEDKGALGKPDTNELAYSAYVAKIKKIPYVFADTNIADWIQDFERVSHHKAVILQTMLILNKAFGYKKHFNKNDTIENAYTNVKCDLSELGFDMQLTIQEFKDCAQKDFGVIVSDKNISDILATIPNWRDPNINGHITNKIWAEMGMISRNPYMLDNIFKAVNKHNTVLVTMGAGHYEEQRLVLEKAFGEPKYVYKFPKTKRFDMQPQI